MAKSKKSKILASMLAVSTMAVFYASPVMAAELWHNDRGTVVTDNAEASKKVGQIKTLEGLEEITLGDSVKITTTDGGIIRVGDAGGVNTRVHKDGFYVNTSGDNRNELTETSLKAGTLTLAGEELTFKQLANINTVIGENGVITAANGSTVGGVRMNAGRVSGNGFFVRGSDNALDTTGLKLGDEYLDETKLGTINGVITDGGAVVSKGDVTSTDGTNTYHLNNVGKNTSGITSDIEGKVTTIEGAFSVDEKGYIYNANRSFQVTKDGAARFGNKYDDHIRMDDGVLSVKTDQTTTVARVSKDGFYVYKDNGTTVAGSLTKNGLTADSINVGGENFTVAHNGSVKAADERFIIDADGSVTATEFTAGGYKLTDIGEKTAGIRRTQSGATDVTVIEENLKVYDDGTIVGANNKFRVTADGTVFSDKLNVGNGKFTVSDEGIGAFGSQFTVNTNGEISTTGINVAEGMFTASAGGVTMAKNNLSVDINGNIKAGTYNGVKIGMNVDGDIILGDGTVIDNNFNSDNVAGITREPLNDSAPGSGNTTYIEQNTAISADGIVVTDPRSGVSTKTKYNGFYVKDEYGNNVSSLKDDGLMLTDQESGKRHTLNATDIADIKGIDRSYDEETNSYTTTIEKALSISDDGSFATTNGSFSVDAEGNLYSTNGTVTVQTRENLAAVQLGQTTLGMSDEDITMSVGRGTAIALSKYTGINLSSGGNNIALNSDGAVFTNDNIEGSTVIKGGNVTTGTITADDLHVDNIYLGNQIVDEEGNVVGSDLAIGADGSIKIADNFEVDTDNLAAHYVGEDDEYELTLDGTNGFALRNSEASLTLNGSGYTFSGPVNLGAGSDVKYTGGNYGTLAKLDATVKDIYDRTDGIYKDSEGNTVISKEEGTWNGTKTVYEGEGSKVVVGDNGTTFVNGASNGTTNIDGSKITSDADGRISGGSGPSTNNIGNPVGSSTTNGEETVYDGENGNTNTVNSSGMTVTNSTSTTVIDAEKVDTTTGNFSNKVTVGIQGNQTVITGGDIRVDNSVTVAGGSENKTTINNEGITVGDKGTSIKNDSISVGDGGYIGDGDVRSGEGVSLNDTAERVGHLENRVGKLEDRVDKVGAMAAAIANLRTMGYDPAAPTEVAVGIGQYRDETGAALGLFHYPNRDFMLSLSVSTSGDEVMGGIGATWKFGRKSPEKVAEIKKAQAEADARRAEEAKLAKAEEMKQAAKEAKIKAQQERHAKLAAQAEAAK